MSQNSEISTKSHPKAPIVNIAYNNNMQTIKHVIDAISEGKNPSHEEMINVFMRASETIANLPNVDVFGMTALVDRLRHELRHIRKRNDPTNSLTTLSNKINVSRTYLTQFRDGGMVCMNIMNRLASEFKIRYMIENYQDPTDSPIK